MSRTLQRNTRTLHRTAQPRRKRHTDRSTCNLCRPPLRTPIATRRPSIPTRRYRAAGHNLRTVRSSIRDPSQRTSHGVKQIGAPSSRRESPHNPPSSLEDQSHQPVRPRHTVDDDFFAAALPTGAQPAASTRASPTHRSTRFTTVLVVTLATRCASWIRNLIRDQGRAPRPHLL